MILEDTSQSLQSSSLWDNPLCYSHSDGFLQEPIWTNSSPNSFPSKGLGFCFTIQNKVLSLQGTAPSINFFSKVPHLPSGVFIWTYWLSMQVFLFDFVVAVVLGWFPNVIAQYCQQIERLENSPEKWSMHFSLSPSLNPHHSFFHKGIPLPCFISLNDPTTLPSLRMLFSI